jgi:acylphosphatase
MPTSHLIIKGRVQGVFYRATAKDMADELGITGWVKNTVDGDVEITATGAEERLQQFIEWCKMGPRKAIVTDVVVTKKDVEEKFKSFAVIRG